MGKRELEGAGCLRALVSAPLKGTGETPRVGEEGPPELQAISGNSILLLANTKALPRSLSFQWKPLGNQFQKQLDKSLRLACNWAICFWCMFLPVLSDCL